MLLPGGHAAACQLGGDRLGPHLGELADLAVVVCPAVRVPAGLRCGPPLSGPLPGASCALVAIEDLGAVGRSPGALVQEARRLCRPGGTVLVGLRSGARRPRLPAALRAALRDAGADGPHRRPGGVLRALAAAPGTWCDELVGVARPPEASGTSPTATTRGAHDGRG
jgi:hypothetical protein